MPTHASVIASLVVVMLACCLAGCGNALSPPEQGLGAGSPNAEIAAAQRYAGSSSAFVEIPSRALAKADQVGSCGVDQIDEQVAFLGVPLDHTGMGTFLGWAGDADARIVPPKIQVVLAGPAGDFAVSASTGIARPDVAENTAIKAFATSGFKVKADMDGVPIGDYDVGILVQGTGVTRFCATEARVSVQ